jgi:hypothetical protein
MRYWKLVPALVLACALLQPALAQVKSGTAGAQFLKLSPTARGLAMADALLPLADDVSALYYNPGGLVQLPEGWHHSITHYALPVEVSQNWVGSVYSDPESGSAYGVSLTWLRSGMMDVNTPEMPNGTGQQFDWQDFALGASYARRLTNKFSVGVTAKLVRESTYEFHANGWAADVGTYYDTGWKSVKLAMSITNFGPDMTFIDKPFPLPIQFKFGVSADLIGKKADDHYMHGAFEFGHPSDNVEQINVAAEYAYKDQFILRLGKKINAVDQKEWDEFDPESGYEYPLLSLDGLTLGAGFKWQSESLGRFGLDYAFAPSRFLETRNMITLSWTR